MSQMSPKPLKTYRDAIAAKNTDIVADCNLSLSKTPVLKPKRKPDLGPREQETANRGYNMNSRSVYGIDPIFLI